MRINKKIRKLGITQVSELNKITKKHLCQNVSSFLAQNCENTGLNINKIYEKLLKTKMYVADIPSKIAKVNYMYYDSALYFDRSVDLSKIDENILHEIIHKIQEKKKGKRVIRLGLCDFKDTKIEGFAFNEAGISYVVSKIFNRKNNIYNIDDLKIKSIGSSQYALITSLMEQIIFLTNQEEMLNYSILNSNDDFLYKCYDYFGESEFKTIKNGFDEISKNINETGQAAQKYIEVQEKIFISYFDNYYNSINKLDEIKNYKNKMIEYGEMIGTKEGYNYYKKYSEIQYIKISNLEEKLANKSLMIISNNPVIKAITNLRNIYRSRREYNK